MKKGDIVKVTTQCVPKGLVPDKMVELHYEYETDGGTKWYATPTERHDFTTTVDSHKIYMLRPEKNEKCIA